MENLKFTAISKQGTLDAIALLLKVIEANQLRVGGESLIKEANEKICELIKLL